MESASARFRSSRYIAAAYDTNLKEWSARKSLLSGAAFRYNVPEMSLRQLCGNLEIAGSPPRVDQEPARLRLDWPDMPENLIAYRSRSILTCAVLLGALLSTGAHAQVNPPPPSQAPSAHPLFV